MTRSNLASVAMIALFASSATVAGAQGTARVAVAPESKLWIDGTSNLHAWTCKATVLEATVELDAATATLVAVAPPKSLKRVEIKVPVKSIKCGHGGMDDNLYKALKADASPDISYIMGTFDAVPGEAKDSFTFHTVGTLTVAGKQNNLTMDVVATRMPDGTVRATGVVPILMTDYDVKPPTALFGRIKTGNEVKINFELSVGAKAIAAATGQP